jgi:UDPglucose--hexose-1-phosphate uridylyltransferase
VRKFVVGYELAAEPQRDFTPEEAARRLRAASEAPGPRAEAASARRGRT